MATGYLLLFQFYKVVVGRMKAAAYIHCSLKVGVPKSSSFDFCCITVQLLSLVHVILFA